MQRPVPSEDFGDADVRPPRKADTTAMRILARWVALNDRVPVAGAIVDRDFVVLEPRRS